MRRVVPAAPEASSVTPAHRFTPAAACRGATSHCTLEEEVEEDKGEGHEEEGKVAKDDAEGEDLSRFTVEARFFDGLGRTLARGVAWLPGRVLLEQRLC